jgi:hypothetical protein
MSGRRRRFSGRGRVAGGTDITVLPRVVMWRLEVTLAPAVNGPAAALPS